VLNGMSMTATHRPIELAPDKFTPLTRAPWGGTRLCEHFKHGVGSPGQRVGESWELSVGPELPSKTRSGEDLGAVLGRDPKTMLGEEAALGRTVTALLLKWIDSAADLSLQIHPPDDAPSLRADEAGKIEAWYVVDHEPGARIYLGLVPGTDEAKVRNVLEQNGDLSQCMASRLVTRGDLVIVDPGTPHAIGRGITLLEPQHVAPSKRAVTYRYWDWNTKKRARLDAPANPPGTEGSSSPAGRTKPPKGIQFNE
jgi:mannose-6-phosphate isomerase